MRSMPLNRLHEQNEADGFRDRGLRLRPTAISQRRINPRSELSYQIVRQAEVPLSRRAFAPVQKPHREQPACRGSALQFWNVAADGGGGFRGDRFALKDRI